MTAQTLPAPDLGAAAAQLRLALAAIALAACFVLAVRTAPSVGGIAAASAAPTFSESAHGAASVASALVDRPGGGALVAPLAPGEPVAIGGRIEVPAGLVARVAYWARAGSGEAARYGFVDARDVVVVRGSPMELDIAGRPIESFLAPTGAAGSPAIGAPRAPEGETLGAVGLPNASALALASAPGGTSSPGAWPAWLPATVTRWSDPIVRAAAASGVDPVLVALVVLVESGGLPSAASPAGAVGLMQLMPGAAAEAALSAGGGLDPANLTHPETNIRLGTAYLAGMLRAFGTADDPDWQASVELAAAAYNGGPGHVGQHLTTGAPLFPETAAYRGWVGGMWRERGQPTSPTFEAWLAAGGARLVEAAAGAQLD